MANEVDPNQSPSKKGEDEEREESLFSPGFRSVVAMAGWDEEALLMASLVVEDTPDRDTKYKKRFKTPPTTSRRKRRSQRKSPASVAIPALDLDEATKTLPPEESEKRIDEMKGIEENKKVEEVKEIKNCEKGASISCSSSSFPCIDRLREELSCAICLEICFEPSTTPCGHSFCKKCLRSAADKCGKRCPKCRQLISNGRSCTVNTVLWNTIQLIFPQEIETRKELAKSKSPADKTTPPIRRGSKVVEIVGPTQPVRRSYYNARNRSMEALNSPENDRGGIQIARVSRRRENLRGGRVASQDEDAALALRLQREEFMVAFRAGENDTQQQQIINRRSHSLNSARANLRAMASRAINIRNRERNA